MKYRTLSSVIVHFSVFLSTCLYPVPGKDTLQVGETGWHVNRPVIASACREGYLWGEIGDLVKKTRESPGYQENLCRDCNFALEPGIVSSVSHTPPHFHSRS